MSTSCNSSFFPSNNHLYSNMLLRNSWVESICFCKNMRTREHDYTIFPFNIRDSQYTLKDNCKIWNKKNRLKNIRKCKNLYCTCLYGNSFYMLQWHLVVRFFQLYNLSWKIFLHQKYNKTGLENRKRPRSYVEVE